MSTWNRIPNECSVKAILFAILAELGFTVTAPFKASEAVSIEFAIQAEVGSTPQTGANGVFVKVSQA